MYMLQHDSIRCASHLQSCPNSWQALQWWPHKGSIIPGNQFIQLLRKRFAIPCLVPLDEEYRCGCGLRKNPVSLRAGPYHGLHCKAIGRHQRQTQRHDKVQDALAAALRKVPKLEVLEVRHPRMGSGQRPEGAADIKLVYDGVQYVLDCCVTAVATTSNVRKIRTHLIPGTAANRSLPNTNTTWTLPLLCSSPLQSRVVDALTPEHANFLTASERKDQPSAALLQQHTGPSSVHSCTSKPISW